jgi:uncharacterized protein (TIGR03382 family)
MRHSTMSWRFQRRKKLLPGLTLNVGKRGGSLSAGPRGAKMSASPRGVTATLSLLGTGLAYVWRRRRR